MKRKLLFCIGRMLDWVGTKLEFPGRRLSSFGMNLWDQNCDCVKCIERKDGTYKVA